MNTTFAPPTGQPVTSGAAAPVPPPADAADVTPPNGSRRRGVVALAVALVAVLALGAGAFAVFGDRDEVVSETGLASFSLVAAAEQAITAPAVEFDLSVTADGIADVALSGAVDNETSLLVLEVDATALLPMGDLAGSGDGSGSVEMIVDGDTGIVYLGADELGGLVPGGAPWVSADLNALAELSGQSLDDLRSEFFLDPTESARVLLDAEQVTELGPETLDGVETVRYQVTVDLAAALAATPQAGAELDGLGVPDTVVYDVWVTEDNQLRRATFDVEVGGQSVTTTLEMRAVDERLDVELPTDAFDLTAFLDGF